MIVGMGTAALLFVLLGAPRPATTVDRIAATVNDVAIAESEVRRAMAVSALKPEPTETPEAFRARVLEEHAAGLAAAAQAQGDVGQGHGGSAIPDDTRRLPLAEDRYTAMAEKYFSDRKPNLPV